MLIYFAAPDLETMLGRASELGGRVIIEKTRISKYGFIGIVEDTEGNRIGLYPQT